MYPSSVAVLGARCTGKTTLASRCLGTSYKSDALATHDSPYALGLHTVAFVERVPNRVGNVFVLDPKPRATPALLAQDLARRSVPACLVTMPRHFARTQKESHADKAAEWVSFAREHCPFARIALVATSAGEPSHANLAQHEFDTLTLDVMQRANADRLFYAESNAAESVEGVKAWLLDVLSENANPAHRGVDLSHFGAHSTAVRGGKSRRSQKTRNGCGDSQRTCDSCVVA